MAGTGRRRRRIKMIFYYPIVAVIIALGVVIFTSVFPGGPLMVSSEAEEPSEAKAEQAADALLPEEPLPDLADVSPTPEPAASQTAASRLLPYRSNGRWGYKNTSGQIVIQARFSDAYEFDGDVAVAAVNNTGEALYGVIDRQGKWIVEPAWQGASRFLSELAAIEVNDKWGYADKTGKVVIAPAYDEAEPFTGTRARVKKGSKWGYIDLEGSLVIDAKYSSATDFSEGYAFVVLKGATLQRLIIDEEGRTAATLKTAEGARFSSGLAAVKLSGTKDGYINLNGKLAFDATFQEALDFSQKLAPVKKDGEWFYINEQGISALPGKYGDAKPFSEGLAAVKPGGKYGYIDTSGQLVIEAAYDEAEPFAGGYALVRRGPERGVIDRAGVFKLLYADTE